MYVFLLTFAGLFLIFLEFFLPGLVLAMVGAAFLGGAAILVYFKDPTFLVYYLVILLVLLFITIQISFWRLKKSKYFSPKDHQEGFSASAYSKELIGKTGVAESDLKPSGIILIEGKRMQATSREGYIDKGEEVEVVGGEGFYLTIRRKI